MTTGPGGQPAPAAGDAAAGGAGAGGAGVAPAAAQQAAAPAPAQAGAVQPDGAAAATGQPAAAATAPTAAAAAAPAGPGPAAAAGPPGVAPDQPAPEEPKLDTEEGKRSALMRICERGDLKAAQDLYAKAPPTSLNYKETLKCECSDGTHFTFERSPLLWAIHAKNHRLVAFLIKHGADVNWKCDGEYALHRAVWGVNLRQDPQLELVKAVLAGGADPNAISDLKGWTALHYASCEPRNFGPIQLLMAAGADPNVPDIAQGFTPYERMNSVIREYEYLKDAAIMWNERLAYTIRFYRNKFVASLVATPAIAAALTPTPSAATANNSSGSSGSGSVSGSDKSSTKIIELIGGYLL